MSNLLAYFTVRFHTSATVDEETFPQGTGTSKKNAKKAASILALRVMYDRGMQSLRDANHIIVSLARVGTPQTPVHSVFV